MEKTVSFSAWSREEAEHSRRSSNPPAVCVPPETRSWCREAPSVVVIVAQIPPSATSIFLFPFPPFFGSRFFCSLTLAKERHKESEPFRCSSLAVSNSGLAYASPSLNLAARSATVSACATWDHPHLFAIGGAGGTAHTRELGAENVR